jgi:hypothetical protein
MYDLGEELEEVDDIGEWSQYILKFVINVPLVSKNVSEHRRMNISATFYLDI